MHNVQFGPMNDPSSSRQVRHYFQQHINKEAATVLAVKALTVTPSFTHIMLHYTKLGALLFSIDYSRQITSESPKISTIYGSLAHVINYLLKLFIKILVINSIKII